MPFEKLKERTQSVPWPFLAALAGALFTIVVLAAIRIAVSYAVGGFPAMLVENLIDWSLMGIVGISLLVIIAFSLIKKSTDKDFFELT